MKMSMLSPSCKQTERGQGTVAVILSLGVLLLLVIGIVILCVALFTATTIEDYEEGGKLFETFEMQAVSDVASNVFGPSTKGLEVITTQLSPSFITQHAAKT
jgi:hypothetical protein